MPARPTRSAPPTSMPRCARIGRRARSRSWSRCCSCCCVSLSAEAKKKKPAKKHKTPPPAEVEGQGSGAGLPTPETDEASSDEKSSGKDGAATRARRSKPRRRRSAARGRGRGARQEARQAGQARPRRRQPKKRRRRPGRVPLRRRRQGAVPQPVAWTDDVRRARAVHAVARARGGAVARGVSGRVRDRRLRREHRPLRPASTTASARRRSAGRGATLTTKYQDFLAGLKVRIPRRHVHALRRRRVRHAEVPPRAGGRRPGRTSTTRSSARAPARASSSRPSIDLDLGAGYLIVTEPGLAGGRGRRAGALPERDRERRRRDAVARLSA